MKNKKIYTNKYADGGNFNVQSALAGAGGIAGHVSEVVDRNQKPELSQLVPDLSSAMTKTGLNELASTFRPDAGVRSTGQMAKDFFMTDGLAGLNAGSQMGNPWAMLAGTASAQILGGIGNVIGNKKKRELEMQAKEDFTNKLMSQNNLINRQTLANISAEGGAITTNGMEGISSLNVFNSGSSHQESPIGGIPQGVDNEGKPNLVEKGETKWNNYIFSNRLSISDKDKKVIDELGLPKSIMNKSYANASIELNKESEEREFDPISKIGRNDFLSKLAALQELRKSKTKTKKEENNSFPSGGPLDQLAPLPKKDVTDIVQAAIADRLNPKMELAVKPTRVNTSTAPSFDFTNSLRYAPVASNAMQLASLIGRKPVNQQAYTISPERLTDRMEYNPIDSDYITNKTNQQAAATNRALQNNAMGNSALANTLLMSQSRNNQQSLSDAMMQINQLNEQKRNQALQYNNSIQAQNISNDLAAQQFNAQSRMNADVINQQEKDALESQRRNIISQIGSQLGDIGTEQYRNDMAQKTYNIDYNKELGQWSPLEFLKAMEAQKSKTASTTSNAFGGKLFKK